MPRRALVLTLLLSGCSCEQAAPPPREIHPIEVPQAVLDPILFDERGRLRPSDTKIGALVLPVGLDRVAAGDGEEVFEGEVPVRAVHAYFRARVVSPSMSESGDTLRLGDARPATERGVADEHYDVTIASDGRNGARVRVVTRTIERPTISEDERRRRMSEAMRREGL